MRYWFKTQPSFGAGQMAPGFALLIASLLCLAAAHPGRIVTDQTGRQVNLPEHPQRLISLAPSITETLYALGMGDRIVGDTIYCDYPPEARLKPHVGTTQNPSLEQIVALKPDLVLGTDDANRRETADQIERLGIPLYGVASHSVEGTLDSIQNLGEVLGEAAGAKALADSLRKRIEAVVKSVQGKPAPRVLFVVWYRPLITAGQKTFIADAIRLAGGVSIADDLAGEWPRLSLEDALHRDPDIILFSQSESFSPSLDEFQKLPGWRDFRAVKNHRLYFISNGINRPSPRLIDAVEEVARILHPPPSAIPHGGEANP